MQGFFSKKETESVSSTGGKIHSCASCGLYKHCSSPKMKPYGKFEKDILVIGSYPEVEDDANGKPFTGKYGALLKKELKRLGIDLYRDCLSTFAVNCRPPKRQPTSIEIDHCRSVMVWGAIKKYQPKMILVLGQEACASVIGQQWTGGDSITQWRGFCVPDQELKSWVCPTYSPNYLTHIDRPAHYMKIWRDDLERALDKVEEPFPRHSPPDIRYEEDCSFIERLPSVLSAFDYETTGIKPHKKGHRIACVSIAVRPEEAWVFPAPKTKAGWLPFRKWLHNKKIPKMAHNLKYEHSWSKNILKVTTRGWEWDSMVAAHVLDNRPGITGLKFQTYAQFGIRDYSTEVERFLKSSDKYGANTKNEVLRLMKSSSGAKSLMKYCAFDSAYQYRLAVKQMEELNYEFLPF